MSTSRSNRPFTHMTDIFTFQVEVTPLQVQGQTKPALGQKRSLEGPTRHPEMLPTHFSEQCPHTLGGGGGGGLTNVVP